MIDGQFLIEDFLSQRFGFMEEFLEGILLVFAMITLLGSGLPMGPRKIIC
jgi:hypothetical protein